MSPVGKRGGGKSIEKFTKELFLSGHYTLNAAIRTGANIDEDSMQTTLTENLRHST